jgi:hypothetical protein
MWLQIGKIASGRCASERIDMAALSEEARADARAEEDRWGDAGEATEGVGAALALTYFFPPAIGPAIVVGFGLSLLHIYAGRKARSASRKANDPPRDDYFVAVILEEPERFISLGDSAFGRAMTELLEAIARTVTLEEAMVVADERATGARLAGDSRFQTIREDEALNFGLNAAELNKSLRPRCDTLAALLEGPHAAEAQGPAVRLAAALREAGQASEAYGLQFLSDHEQAPA